MKHEISAVKRGSIAYELNILPGDFLLTVDGDEVIDVLDYQFRVQSENLIVEIEKSDAEVWEMEIEKEYDEDLGLDFVLPLMSELKQCKNNCIFCFIDQEPKGLRKTLYIKDDDWRLSFLHGNFVTLTNVTESEAKRIASLHLSPLYISVHAASESVRRKMMNFTGEDNLFKFLHMFGDAGIQMHFQIVLCKGINDDEVLTHTIKELKKIKGAASIAIIPAGLTKHRHGLYPLKPFTGSDLLVLSVKGIWFSTKFDLFKFSVPVFFSDEWYLMKGSLQKMPDFEQYLDFPQLANGVGMTRLFEHDFVAAVKEFFKPSTPKTKSIFIVTGTLSASFMRRLAFLFGEYLINVRITVIPIINHFYGESITVSGLLTGRDVMDQLNGRCECDVLYLPENAFMFGTEEMLDGITRTQLEDRLETHVRIGSQNGGIFARQLYEEVSC